VDDTRIIATFVIIADVLTALGHRDHCLAAAGDAEVLLVAVIAATYFQNHHERALSILQALHYLSGPLSISRFNHRLHHLAAWLPYLAEVLGRLFEHEACLIIDSLPVPVCRRHLVCTPAGIPVRYSLLPAAYHDLTPIHELLWELPAGVWVLRDKGYNSATDEAGIRTQAGVAMRNRPSAAIYPHCPYLLSGCTHSKCCWRN